MILFLLCLSLLSPQAGEGAKAADKAPSAEEVARAGDSLESAFRSGDPRSIEAALLAAQTVPHPDIVKRIERGLADERKEVRLATLQALRWIDLSEAVQPLHRAAKRRELMKDPELAAAILRGIGQHADPSSVDVLARDPFEPNDHACRRARIFGLARIRSREALEALLGILAITNNGPKAERRIQPQMDDVRVGLVVLTGVDQGLSPELWDSWWRKNKKTFVLAEDFPVLAKEMRQQWDGFWGQPRIYERETRREDRGR